MNQLAIKFVKNLVAVCTKYPISADTKEQYAARISLLKLTPAQWGKALDMIIEQNDDGSLPPLKEVLKFLDHAQRQGKPEPAENMGWISFMDGRGIHRNLRVYAQDGVWLIARLTHRDAHGQDIEVQKHVGEPAALHIPKDATDIIATPDRQAEPCPEDMATREEIRVLVDSTLRQIGRRNAA